MNPKLIIEFLRGDLDITTLSESDKKDLISGLREDYSKVQTELVVKNSEIAKFTEQVNDLNKSVDELTAAKEELENKLQAYAELEKQREATLKERLLSEIEEEMQLIGRPMDEEQKTKFSGFDVQYLETFLGFITSTPVNMNDLKQDPPIGDTNIEEGTLSDPNDVYKKEDNGSKKPVKTLWNAERFGKSEYK